MDKSKSNDKRRPQKRSYNKRNFKERREDETKYGSKVVKDNDPNWYLVNGQLAKDVANFSFNFATGDKIHFDPDITSGSGLNSSNIRLPGICAMYSGPSVGISNGPTSPVNVAAKDIYSFVRHANSGHANYDTPDLMLYLLAADSVQTYWSYMVRALGVARVYSQTNRYIGDAMLEAMGINSVDFRANIAQMRAYVNQYAIKAGVLAVPNTMTYFLRHQWMYQNVYMDEDNAHAQMFMYVPAYVYKYSINSETSAGELIPEWVSFTVSSAGVMQLATKLTFGALKTIGDNLINAMLSQEDVGIISGDILKAYGSEKLYRFAQVDENYAIAPVFSEEVLAQFHNTDLAGRYIGLPTNTEGGVKCVINPAAALTVGQVTGVGAGDLSFNPYVVGTSHLAYNKFLDFWKQDVTPEDCLVGSRNKLHTTLVSYSVQTLSGSAITAKAFAIDTTGSEIVFDAYIYAYDSLTGLLVANGTAPTTADGTTYNSSILGTASKFNQYPLLNSVSYGLLNMPVGSLSNFTVINGVELAAMNNAALLSMFGVPYRW